MNLLASAEDIRDKGLIFELGRSAKEYMATHSSILAWRIPWTFLVCLQSIESQRVGHN